MGKLQDYYRLFDMFKGNLTDEQKAILEALEDQLIAEEILPAISESVAPVLGNLRRPLSLIVDYNPEIGITVKTTRSEVVVQEKTVKKYEIPSKSPNIENATCEDSLDNDLPSKKSLKRSPATGLCVWITPDEFVQEVKASHTMTRAIEIAGPKKVAELAIKHDGEILVTKTRHPKYFGTQQPLSGGYLVNTHSSTETKKKQLEKISDALQLGWKVEII